jgi:hypothetical protein
VKLAIEESADDDQRTQSSLILKILSEGFAIAAISPVEAAISIAVAIILVALFVVAVLRREPPQVTHY